MLIDPVGGDAVHVPLARIAEEAGWDAFFALADKLRSGLAVPPVILVSADGGRTRVVLEGHTRITAYALAPEAIPDEVEVILGDSPEIARWDEY